MNYLTEYYKQQSILLEQEYKKLYSQYVYLNEMMDTSGGGGDEAGLGDIWRRIFGVADDAPKPRPHDPPNPHLRPHGRDGGVELPPGKRPVLPNSRDGGPPIATPGQKRPAGTPSGLNPSDKKPPLIHPNGTIIGPSSVNPNIYTMDDRYYFMDGDGIVYQYNPGSGMWNPNAPAPHPWSK